MDDPSRCQEIWGFLLNDVCCGTHIAYCYVIANAICKTIRRSIELIIVLMRSLILFKRG